MEVDDNLMWPERRRAERVRADVPVRWEGLLEKNRGTISDISVTGCFILSGGAVKTDELVSVEMDVPSLLQMQLWATVVYSSEPIGFAVRFKELSASEQSLLDRVINHLRERSRAQASTRQ
jgi:c-di-GMP-binding flagellar brake protein YcgR